MLIYVCNQSITNKKFILYLIILYLNIDISKDPYISNVVALIILKSLRRDVSSYKILGIRSMNLYIEFPKYYENGG
jgi:hypothetical protein